MKLAVEDNPELLVAGGMIRVAENFIFDVYYT